MSGKTSVPSVGVFYVFASLLSATACRPASEPAGQPAPKSESPQAPVAPTGPATTLDFDAALRSDDAAANEFVERAMKACAAADYAAVRSMWTGRGQPLWQSDFEENWRNVQRITIRAMERVGLAGEAVGSPASPQPGFVLVADVQLDPATVTQGSPPGRQVVLTMVQEDGSWRLASAPKSVKLWIEEKLGRVVIPKDTSTPVQP
jgi:hypothetical protein